MSCARFELVEDVRVVHLDGCAGDDDLGEALAPLSDHAGPTIHDLADVTLVGRVEALDDELVDRCGAVCVVARRHTARVILQRSGIGDRCSVFPTVADALRSLEAGGDGRRPTAGVAR